MKNIPSWLTDTVNDSELKKPEQSSLFDAAKEDKRAERKATSVSDINRQIKTRLEQDFSVVWVKGEISNFVAHRSGHYYFSLKDDKAQISAVMFKGMNAKLKFQAKNGMEVIVQAKVTAYEPRGTYQLMCQDMQAVGAGSMQQAFADLKAKLKAEGLFEPAHKKKLPTLPKKIAIITSPTGAAIRDIIHVLERRARGIDVLLIPALVQGETAAASMITALSKVEALQDIDVVIIGRGGGSAEDLWAFNNEELARKIYALKIPIVAATGHEIDFTICDFVADLRAPTPSAAAELVVANREDMQLRINNSSVRLKSLQSRMIISLKDKALSISKRLISPQKHVEQLSQRRDDLDTRLIYRMKETLAKKRSDLVYANRSLPSPQKHLNLLKERLIAMTKQLKVWQLQKITDNRNSLHSNMAVLDSLSPLNVLERGYAITFKDKKVIHRAAQVKMGDEIEIKYHDKNINAKVLKN